MKQQRSRKYWLSGLILLLGLFAIITQLILLLGSNRKAGITAGFTVANFFSFFTILSNCLVVLAAGIPLLIPRSGQAAFFRRPVVISAIALYIFIVALVYNLVLRGLMPLKGLNILCDELLHVVDPLLFIIYWFLFVPSRSLQWRMIFTWLLFPAVYLAYTIIRGSFTHWYPYPFVNADTLGYGMVALNSLAVLAAFLITGCFLVLLKRER